MTGRREMRAMPGSARRLQANQDMSCKADDTAPPGDMCSRLPQSTLPLPFLLELFRTGDKNAQRLLCSMGNHSLNTNIVSRRQTAYQGYSCMEKSIQNGKTKTKIFKNRETLSCGSSDGTDIVKRSVDASVV
ncbi:hypothetical protein RRG08_056440 [Elysia crispata]|uniref:Uncharacterized protein n=1 Tax=Elysia crispata TaxID=231223 RepID=A0AAE0Z2A2_9GAST|nr:hypothetical protein RRG08_056440 [Elysia crispata]